MVFQWLFAPHFSWVGFTDNLYDIYLVLKEYTTNA